MILAIKHIDIEGPGFIQEYLDASNDLRILDLSRGDSLPGNLSGIEGIISLGGPMNAYEEDKYPFLKDEDRLLKKAVNEQVPVLGICLGAQLLAKACGARVMRAEEKEIGFYGINITEEGKSDLLFSGLPSQLKVFQWHEDTFEIPSGASLLARGASCRNQAFRIGKNVYGLQFHLEATLDMIESWVARYKGSADMLKAEKIKGFFSQSKKQAKVLCANFNRIIKQR
jgi:GMP synthase-like glutamine amidotransferase